MFLVPVVLLFNRLHSFVGLLHDEITHSVCSQSVEWQAQSTTGSQKQKIMKKKSNTKQLAHTVWRKILKSMKIV